MNGDHNSTHTNEESCIENRASDDEVLSESEGSSHSSKKANRKIRKRRKEHKVINAVVSSCHENRHLKVISLNNKYDISDDQLSIEKLTNKSALSRSYNSHNISDSSMSDASSSMSSELSKDENEINSNKDKFQNELFKVEIVNQFQLNNTTDEFSNVHESCGTYKSNTKVENIPSSSLGFESELNVRNYNDQIKDQQNGESTPVVSEKESGGHNNISTSLPDDTLGSANEVAIDKALSSQVNIDIEQKYIESAIEWLRITIEDISCLGTLVAMQANKFSEKKITEHSLKNYKDVLETHCKLKQLIGGVHTNYQQIEQSLESNLVPWKVLTKLEIPNNSETVAYETSQGYMSVEQIDNKNTIVQECENLDQLTNLATSLPKSSQDEEIVNVQGDSEVSVNDLVKTHLEENEGPIISKCNRISTEIKGNQDSELNLSLDPDCLLRTDYDNKRSSEDAENKNSCSDKLNIQEKEIKEHLQSNNILKQQEHFPISSQVSQCSVMDEDNSSKVDGTDPLLYKTICCSDHEKSSNGESKQNDNFDKKVIDSIQDDISPLKKQDNFEISNKVNPCFVIDESQISKIDSINSLSNKPISCSDRFMTNDLESKQHANCDNQVTDTIQDELSPLKQHQNKDISIEVKQSLVMDEFMISTADNIDQLLENYISSDGNKSNCGSSKKHDNCDHQIIDSNQDGLLHLQQPENVEISNQINQSFVMDEDEIGNVSTIDLLPDKQICCSDGGKSNDRISKKNDNCDHQVIDYNQGELLSLKQEGNLEISYQVNQCLVMDEDMISIADNIDPLTGKPICSDGDNSNNGISKKHDNCDNQVIDSNQDDLSPLQQQKHLNISNQINQCLIGDEDKVSKSDNIDPFPAKLICSDGGKYNYNESKKQDNCDRPVLDYNQGDCLAHPVNLEDTHSMDINQSYEALQQMLEASTDGETRSSLSSTDDSGEIQFDDSDLEIIKVTCNHTTTVSTMFYLRPHIGTK